MKGHRLLIAIVAVVGLLAAAAPAQADGIIIPEPPLPLPRPEPVWLTIRYHRVSVSIEDQVATTRIDQVFVNEHDWQAEGTYVFPLPQGATVSEFVMWVDGQPVEAEILEADRARAIYEDIVRRHRDPALLEYVGRDAVQARIFPIPPGGERRIQLEYTQILPLENGLVRYAYPLDTERFSARPLEDCSIRVEIRSADPIRAVYSPTHQDRVFVERDGEYRTTVSYEETDVLPDKDFEVVYTVSQEDVGLNLLTYRESPDDGFFLLLVAPSVEVREGQVQPRDVFLVLDTSGSMDGEKIRQAKDALAYVLEHLNPEDRFNVIAFSSGLSTYAGQLRPVSEADEAIDWVRRLEAVGGTDINRALLEALDQADRERPTVLIFLTDGQPTEGVTEVDQILANVESSAGRNVRLFPFGVGDDVNVVLLDALATQNRGATGYVRPDERIDEEVSAFYAKVSMPVLTDISLDFEDVVVEDTYPYPLPDLFAGTQLILVGRYRDSGPTRITLSGEVEREQREFVYEGTFRAEGGDDFIPRLWAARKIGYLLTEIRLHGEQEEWVDAVIDLSVRYGIITPYTSFLIEEDLWTEAGREDAVEEFLALPAPPAAGAPAVEMAEEEAGLRGAEAVSEDTLPEEAAQSLRHVGTKTFFLRDGVWTDSAFDAETMTPIQVGFGSEAYFDLLASRPEWGEYMSVGSRVLFVAEGMAYEVVEEAEVGVGPVEIPPTRTPVPVGEAETPVETEEPAREEPGGGLCLGAGVAMMMALAAATIWQRARA
jgi:Ca-activated chloride channel family protein